MPPTAKKVIAPQGPVSSPGGFFSSLGNDFAKRGEDIVNSVKSGADAYQKSINGTLNPIYAGMRLAGTGIQTAGAVAGGALDILKEGVGAIAKPIAKAVVNSPAGQKVTNNPTVQKAAMKIGNAADAMGQKYSNVKTKYPEATKTAEAVANIGALLALNSQFQTASASSKPVKGVTKEMTPDDIKTQINSSEAYNVQRAIKSGDVARDQVFKSGDIVKPEFAQGRIDDIAQKLNMYKDGLGDVYQKGIDVNNLSMKGNVPEELVSRANSLVDALHTPGLEKEIGSLDLAKYADLKDFEADVKTLATNKVAETFMKTPEQIPLYRGEGAGNAGGVHFTPDAQWSQNFGTSNIQGSLPAGAKVFSITPESMEEAISKGITSDGEFYKYLWDKGYDALLGTDSRNGNVLDIVVNPKQLSNFKVQPAR